MPEEASPGKPPPCCVSGSEAPTLSLYQLALPWCDAAQQQINGAHVAVCAAPLREPHFPVLPVHALLVIAILVVPNLVVAPPVSHKQLVSHNTRYMCTILKEAICFII